MRTRLLLLMLFVALGSLNAGILAARLREDGPAGWLWLACLVAVGVFGFLWLHFILLRPYEREQSRRRADEDDVRRHAHELQQLYERAPGGYLSLDVNGRCVRVNDTALAWLGFSRDEVLGRRFAELLAPPGQAPFAERFAAFCRDGDLADVEFHLVRKDGTPLHVLLSAVAQRDDAGRLLVARATFIDVTQRKSSEQRSAEMALRLSAVLDAATSVSVVATDPDGRITVFNPGAERMLGYCADEMLGRECPWAMHLASEVMAQGERLGRETGRPLRGFDVMVDRARRGEPERGEWTYVRKDGATLSVDLVVTALRGAEGQETGFLFVAADVSERVAAARALRMTMEAARAGTWDWDVDADRWTWSDNVESLLGVPRPDLAGRARALALVAAEDRPRVAAALESAVAGTAGDAFAIEFRSAGGPTWVEAKGRAFRDEAGRARRLRGTLMDVTPRREAAAALQAAKEAAEAANQAKTSFLASLSHEIRNPLGAIVGLAEIMSQPSWAASEAQLEQVRTLATAAETLLGLINDVLDVSKIEAGKLELEAIAFDPRALVRDVAAVLSGGAAAKGLALEVSIDDVPARVVGDAGRLRQVLMNLAGNAVKFTARGAVRLGLRGGDQASHAGEAELLFEVRDTGIGIPRDKLLAIFEPFEQADASTTRTHGGTGLGLAISARLVERMGGAIRVASEVGTGSTFSFRLRLPVAAEEAAAAEGPPPPPSPPLSVLLVEDNPVNQEVLSLLLARFGHRVRVAANGRDALVALDAEACDLIFMDLQMPEMDGIRCTRLIRQREKATGRRVPIVAVTANALSGERQRCLAAGMDDYLSKPVRAQELTSAIARLVGRQEGGAAPGWLSALREMGFDDEGIARLARTFLDTVPGRLEALRRAVAARECEEVHRTAHVLKGSLSVFSARSAMDATVRLMHLSQQQQPDGFAAALSELEAEVGPLLASIAAAP